MLFYVDYDVPEYNEYLNIAYQNLSNNINNYSCSGGKYKGCGTFRECEVDNQPDDVPWTFQQGIKKFYITNGKVCYV